ncbi:hypothetical protein [Thalassospira sp.]|uniref:hypothetical protein n=1 Tax=Thalassospira sp. TaxID=1912094 RepID=UPI0027328174|nr:hypothetical protein [Thalassospira sp.]MDP2696663.1 hypothetical protein [Thalassospira sp.]
MTTDQMVIELKSVTYDLISLLERETDGIRTLDISEYDRFVADKSALSMRYEQLVLKLRQRGDELKLLPEENKSELRDLQARFQEAARRNMIALKAAEATNRRMVDAIVRAVKDRAEEGCTTYTSSGRASSAPGNGYSQKQPKSTLSVSLNQTL